MVAGPRPYQPAQIPPQVLLMMMQEQEKKKAEAAQAKNPAEGIFGPAAGAGGAGAAASQLGSSGLAATAGENAAWNSAAMGGEALPETVLPESGLATLAPYAGAAAGTYLVGKGINDLLKGRTDNSNTGKASRLQTGITTGGFSELGRAFGMGAGKGKDQQGRDANRKMGIEKGIYDKDYNLTRLDGVTKNMGLDGSKGTYNIDFKDKAAVDLIPYLDPLSESIAGGDAKRRSDQTGEFANALKDAKDPMAEIRNLYQKYGVGADTFKDYKTEDNRADVYRNSVNTLLGGGSIPKSSTTTPPPVQKPTPGSTTNYPLPLTKLPEGIRDAMWLAGRDGPMGTLEGKLDMANPNIKSTIGNVFGNSIQKLPTSLIPKAPVNNPNSPGFKDGKKITYPIRK